MLDALKLNSDVKVETERDVLGGGLLATDVYPSVLNCIYLETTKSGAVMANMLFVTDSGRKVTESECIASNKTGTLKTTYTGKKGTKNEGKEVPLPGYEKVLNLVRLVMGDEKIPDLSTLAASKRILKLYDFEQRKEVPQEKTVFDDTIKIPVQIAVYKEIVNKRQKGDDGDYHDIAETREQNVIDRVFNEEGKTMQELVDNKEASFKDVWLEAHKGKVRDKTNKNLKQGAPTSGAPSGSTNGAPALDI